jgi:hypothetical protein
LLICGVTASAPDLSLAACAGWFGVHVGVSSWREGVKRGGEGEDGDRINVPQVFVLRHGLLHAGFNLMEGGFVGGGEGGAVFIAGLFGLCGG